MASKLKKDRLSRYFKDMDEIEISSDEDSDSKEESDTDFASKQSNRSNESGDSNNSKNTSDFEAKSITSERTLSMPQRLPSAHECLKSQVSPAFLQLHQPKEVDWDKRLKTLDPLSDEQQTDFKTNAVPPPTSYDPVLDQGTKVVDEEGNKRKRIGDDLEDQATSTKAYRVHKVEDEADT